MSNTTNTTITHSQALAGLAFIYDKMMQQLQTSLDVIWGDLPPKMRTAGVVIAQKLHTWIEARNMAMAMMEGSLHQVTNLCFEASSDQSRHDLFTAAVTVLRGQTIRSQMWFHNLVTQTYTDGIIAKDCPKAQPNTKRKIMVCTETL